MPSHARHASALMTGVMVVLGSLSSFGYNLLGNIRILGMQFLDFFDFLTNSLMMPIAALATVLLALKSAGIGEIESEVEKSSKFVNRKLYRFMLKYLCPALLVIIFISSVLNALGIISM